MTEKVRDVMTKDPIALPSTDSVRDAALKMRSAGVGTVIVTEKGALQGIVTDRDIVVRCVARDNDSAHTKLSEICSKGLTTLSPEDDLDRAIALMREKKVRRLPVAENQKPVGILSLGDLALKRDPRSVLAEISQARPTQ